jgi:hypothetical protein
MSRIIDLRQKTKPAKSQQTEEPKNPEPTQDETPISHPSSPASKLEWTALEFQQYSKNTSWFVVGGLIAFSLFLWAALTKNFLLVILVILGYFTVMAFALKKPRKIRLAITPRGVMIDRVLYRFDNLKSFWIFYDPPELKELSLRSKKTIMPYIKIPLGQQNPVKVRQVLLKYLPERKQEESLIDNLARSLRF